MSVRRAALALILVGLAARPAAAQVGTTTDIISGGAGSDVSFSHPAVKLSARRASAWP